MNLDYYQILGVSPSADLDTIKKAFRQKVMECHPDRGGSHAQMILINEAWEILSNLEFRQHYDSYRNQPGALAEQKIAEADAQTARQRSGNYPPHWKDVEPWLNNIFKDFVNTKYGSTECGNDIFSRYSWPTAGYSVSGWLFILIGAGLVFFGGIYFMENQTPSSEWHKWAAWLKKAPALIKVLIAITTLWIGAWVGSWIHMLISEVMKNSINGQPNRAQTDPPAESTSGKKVIACDKCGQKLRVPSMQTELWVTCRSCGHKFACPPV